MKQKLRRFMAGFLAILTMFTTLFTNGTTAFAASSSANIAFWVASSKDHGVISEFNSKHTGSILYAMIDGHSAYCMNFGLSAKGGQLMNSDSNPNTNLSAAQEKLLAYCMYYGYSTTEAKAPTNDQRNKFIATQSMVWIIVNGIFGTGSADSAASKLCACAPDSSSSYSYYETLRDKINASYNATRPSFASKTNKSSYRCHNGHVSRIRGEELKSALLDIARNMALAQLQEFELKTDGGNCPDNLEREIESLKKSKAHYAKLKFEIYDDYTKANITRDQMAKKTAEVKQKIAEIESLITQKQETLDMQKDLFLDAKQEQLTKLSKLDEFDEEVIRYLIDYVLVYDNEHIEIRWNFDDFQAG